MNHFGSQSGFNLIETTIYVAVFSVVIVGITSFMLLSIQSRVKNQVVNEVEQQGAQAMQRITQSIRNSEGVNTPTIGTSDDSISINTTDPGIDPTVIDYSGGTLQITEGASGTIDLTSDKINVIYLNFDNNTITGTNDTIKIEMTLEYENPDSDLRFNYSKTFYGSATRR